MNFINWSYLPFLVGGFVALAALVLFYENRFFQMIQKYWFYRRSVFSWISTLLFLGGMGGLLLSLMDARGPEQRIKTPVPKQRTIILIDTSASMLAEDVKPSRLQKAVLIAKHFARKAAGHQLSIVAFAEIQKPIVPFTNDLDLIDARLDSLKFLRNQYGSSALTVAVQESIQYFYEGGGEMRGNVIVFTDGEETSEGVKLKIPEGVHVAFVGVGTSSGGRIPLDDGRGFRFGYKKERGKDVITKLNENFFKATVADIPSAKYWLANTYSLPSEEILDFFRSEDKKAEDKQDMVIRPVLMEYIVLPSLILLVLSWLFKSVRVFTLGLLLFLSPARSQDEKVEFTPELIGKMEALQQGKLDQRQRVKLADDLYKAGAKSEALELFDENLPKDHISPDIPKEAYLNYGTALLESGRAQEAFSVYETLKESLPDGQGTELKDKMEKNAVSYFRREKQKKEQKEKEDKEKQNQNDKNQGQSGTGQDQQSQQGPSGQQQQPQGNQGNEKKQDKGNRDKDQDNPDKNGEKKEGEGQEQKKDQPSDSQDGDQEKKVRQKKLAPKLKQLMSDDRQLQMKMIEQNTRDLNRKKQRNSKDW